MSDKKLDLLVDNKIIKSYRYEYIKDGPDENMRIHPFLTIEFPNGETLTIDSVCSGCYENIDYILS